jgi:uncharacterized protein with PQ loop repeat
MNYKHIIGYVATLLSVVSFIPVIFSIAKTKKTNDFPYKTLYLALISNILYIISGYLTSNNVLIVMGIVFIAIHSFILYIKLRYK